MKVIGTALPDVKLIEPHVHDDFRGFFMESWNARAFAEAGIDLSFVQDNHSRSARHVLRGLHYQVRQPQGKIVRAIRGRAFDVAVDLRRTSIHFGRWFGTELSESNRRMIWIPPGFAHGFLALEDNTELLYKCTDFHAAEHERSLLWSDPTVGIAWPLPKDAEPVLSAKDTFAATIAEVEAYI